MLMKLDIFQAKFAESFGCSGLILYTDPADYNLGQSPGSGSGLVYPDTWWLPPSGVQRGTVKQSSGGVGDPLTPEYPSIGQCQTRTPWIYFL